MSEYLNGRQASIQQDFLSNIPDDWLGESPKPLFKTTPAGFSITGSDSRFVLLNEKSSSAGYGTSDFIEVTWLS